MRTLFLVLPLLLLSGCTALTKLSTTLSPNSNPIVQTAINLGVGYAVAGDPLKAAAIRAIAEQVLADADKVTIEQLQATVNAKVTKIAKNPAELAGFMTLTQYIDAYLKKTIENTGGKDVTAQTKVAVSGIANAVILACNMIAPPA